MTLPIPDLADLARSVLWTRTVFDAVAACRRALQSGDVRRESSAAELILKLEMTRMRTGRLVAGTDWVHDAPSAGDPNGIGLIRE